MESGHLYRADSGLRRGNSSRIFRNNAAADHQVFSPSSQGQDDDEEALKWAALEKLPTYDRLRKGILTTSTGAASEVEVQNLGFQERKNLVERLVNVAEEDNEKFLLKLRNRIDRYLNLCFFF